MLNHPQLSDSQTLSANNANFRALCIIRAVVISGQCAALYYAKHQLTLMLPYITLERFLGLFILFTAFSTWRSYQKWPVSQFELFIHLCIDVLAFGGIIYFAGGANNPFISYLLVPLCIAAATLPRRFTWLLFTLSQLSYGLLLFYYIPLDIIAPQQHHSANANLHVVGMWGNFVVSALLITYFISAMAQRLRLRDKELADNREQRLQDEQLLSVATLAAGTAHELGTPLNTIKLIVDDMAERETDREIDPDISLLQQQINLCRDTLRNLVSSSSEFRDGRHASCSGTDFFNNLLHSWQLLRPDCALQSQISDEAQALALQVDGTVKQAILNLLNNAADASPGDIELRMDSRDGNVLWQVDDRGAGLDKSYQPFISDKEQGLGLGLVLSHSTANRFGGKLSWQPRDGGGSRVTLCLPLANIEGGS